MLIFLLVFALGLGVTVTVTMFPSSQPFV